MTNQLINFRLKLLKDMFSLPQKSLLIKRISFVFVILIFLLGSGYFFYHMFNYLSTVSDFGRPLMARIIDNLVMVFFFMILFSNFITAITTYFRSKDLEFYFSLPIKPEWIFKVKYLETATYASWASLVVVIPLIYSYGIVYHSSYISFFVALLAIILFAHIAAAFGNLGLLGLLKIFPRMSRNFSIAGITLGGILAALYFWIGKPEIFRVFEVRSEAELAQFIASLGQVGSIYLPSNWLSKFTRDMFMDRFDIAYFSLLLFSAIALYLLLSEFGMRYYRQIWHRQRDIIGTGRKMFSRLFKVGVKKHYAILTKDVILFIRNPTQWVQLLIFLILMAIYIFSIYRTQSFTTSPFWMALIGFANFSYISFLFATLGVRFIYPSISQEGRCFFLLKSSPMKLRTLLYSKFITYSLAAVITGEVIMLITSKILVTDPLILRISIAAIAVVIITIVSINLGIGAMLPDFNEPNPAKLAAGGGGVIAALICLAYTLFAIALFARPTIYYLRFRGNPLLMNAFIIKFSLFILISFIIVIFFINAGRRHLEQIEL